MRARAPQLRRRVAALAGLAVVAVGPPVQATVPEPGAAGVGDSYFPADGNGGIDVRRYRIHDRYRFRRGRLSGHTVLTVRARRDLSSFNLDFLLPVRRVRVDGVRARYERPDRHELTVTPRRVLRKGQVFRVRVGYSGRPARYAYAGESNWLADRREVVAMNQPHMAPWWFPANDHPSDKARMHIAITVPRGKQVVANGRRVSRHRDGRLVTHRWRSREPMAPYLAMFAAGSFQVETGARDGLPWRLAVSRDLPPYARSVSLGRVRTTPRVIAGLARDLGPYPFATSGGLVTSLPVGFALENQTMPTYPELGHDDTRLVVHEQAHQWFGNAVSLRRWRDIWLNEGAATFMEVRWAAQRRGPTEREWLRQAYDARPASDAFWDLAIGDPGPDRMFDEAVYVRGAMTFQALRQRIGNRVFWRLLRRWAQGGAGSHGTRAELEAMAERVSGEELGGFFRTWLDVGERPAPTRANGLR